MALAILSVVKSEECYRMRGGGQRLAESGTSSAFQEPTLPELRYALGGSVLFPVLSSDEHSFVLYTYVI